MRFRMQLMRGVVAVALVCTLAAVVSAQQSSHDASRHPEHRLSDSAFRALQGRGRAAMGVDQYTSIHRFDQLRDGGRVELQRARADTAGARTIRDHLRAIKTAFESGDFSTPAFVHMRQVPGTVVMAERRSHIRYTVEDLPWGAALRMRTSDAAALAAIHEFMAFQRGDHRASGTSAPKTP